MIVDLRLFDMTFSLTAVFGPLPGGQPRTEKNATPEQIEAIQAAIALVRDRNAQLHRYKSEADIAPAITYVIKIHAAQERRLFLIYHAASRYSFLLADEIIAPNHHTASHHSALLTRPIANLAAADLRISSFPDFPLPDTASPAADKPASSAAPGARELNASSSLNRQELTQFMHFLSHYFNEDKENIDEQMIERSFLYLLSRNDLTCYFKRKNGKIYFSYAIGKSQIHHIPLPVNHASSAFMVLIFNLLNQPTHIAVQEGAALLKFAARSLTAHPTAALLMIQQLQDSPLNLDARGLQRFFSHAFDAIQQHDLPKHYYYQVYSLLNKQKKIPYLLHDQIGRLIQFFIADDFHNTADISSAEWESMVQLISIAPITTAENFIAALRCNAKIDQVLATLPDDRFLMVKIIGLCKRQTQIDCSQFESRINQLFAYYQTLEEDRKACYRPLLTPYQRVLRGSLFQAECESVIAVPRVSSSSPTKGRKQEKPPAQPLPLTMRDINALPTVWCAANNTDKTKAPPIIRRIKSAITGNIILFDHDNTKLAFIQALSRLSPNTAPAYTLFTLLVLHADQHFNIILANLIANHDQNMLKQFATYALNRVCNRLELDKLLLLLQWGANPNHLDALSALLPVHVACSTNHTEKDIPRAVLVLDLLLQYGANPNTRNRADMPPIHYAAQHSTPELAKRLLAYGADINAKIKISNNNNLTALDLALGCQHTQTIAFLRENGAKVSYGPMTCKSIGVQYYQGATTLDDDITQVKFDMAKMKELFLRAWKIIVTAESIANHAELKSLLTESDLSIDTQKECSMGEPTLVHLCVFDGRLDAARVLLEEYQADPNIFPMMDFITGGNKNAVLITANSTPLDTVVPASHLWQAREELRVRLLWDLAQALIKHNADCSRIGPDGETILHRFAKERLGAQIVSLVLRYRVSPALKNINGLFADQLAKQGEQTPLSEAIQKFLMTQRFYSTDKFYHQQFSPSHFGKSFSNKKLIDAIEDDNEDALLDFLEDAENRKLINTTNEHGNTALHLACLRMRLGMIHILIEHGATVTLPNRYRQTPVNLYYIACLQMQVPLDENLEDIQATTIALRMACDNLGNLTICERTPSPAPAQP